MFYALNVQAPLPLVLDRYYFDLGAKPNIKKDISITSSLSKRDTAGLNLIC